MARIASPFGTPNVSDNVTYDFTDIASGTGFIKYLGFGTEDSGGESKKLSNSVEYSEEDGQQVTFSTGNGTKLNVDFDIEFQTTQVARGTAIATFGITITGSRQFTSDITVDIIHYDGSTETVIGTTDLQPITYLGSSQQLDYVVSIDLTQTTFKRGDILRLTVRDDVTITGGSSTSSIKIYHDPTNTAVSGLQTSKLILDMPFRIDL